MHDHKQKKHISHYGYNDLYYGYNKKGLDLIGLFDLTLMGFTFYFRSCLFCSKNYWNGARFSVKFYVLK